MTRRRIVLMVAAWWALMGLLVMLGQPVHFRDGFTVTVFGACILIAWD
jgi:hypothetical protein